MSFDWSGYLRLAEKLQYETDEASLRTAISRAYYYVYHLALERAASNDFKAVLGGEHSQLWRLFKDNPEPTCQVLGSLGNRLKDRRRRADYDPSFGRLAQHAREVISDARKFAGLLEKLPSRHPNPKSQRPY